MLQNSDFQVIFQFQYAIKFLYSLTLPRPKVKIYKVVLIFMTFSAKMHGHF